MKKSAIWNMKAPCRKTFCFTVGLQSVRAQVGTEAVVTQLSLTFGKAETAHGQAETREDSKKFGRRKQILGSKVKQKEEGYNTDPAL